MRTLSKPVMAKAQAVVKQPASRVAKRAPAGGALKPATVAGKAKVFICYDSTEQALVEVLRRHLRSALNLRASDIFLATESITLGQEWLPTIRAELQTAKVFICLLSPSSYLKPWVLFETGAAWLAGATIIPLLHGGLSLERTIEPIRLSQGGDTGDVRTFQRLFENVGKVFGVRDLHDVAKVKVAFEEFDGVAQDLAQKRALPFVSQAGAVCAFVDTKRRAIRYLVVSTSTGKRFTFPKGKIPVHLKPTTVALRELREEAGVASSKLSRLGDGIVKRYTHSDGSSSSVEWHVFMTTDKAVLKAVSQAPSARAPRWLTFEEAKVALRKNRDHSGNGADLLELLAAADRRIEEAF